MARWPHIVVAISISWPFGFSVAEGLRDWPPEEADPLQQAAIRVAEDVKVLREIVNRGQQEEAAPIWRSPEEWPEPQLSSQRSSLLLPPQPSSWARRPVLSTLDEPGRPTGWAGSFLERRHPTPSLAAAEGMLVAAPTISGSSYRLRSPALTADAAGPTSLESLALLLPSSEPMSVAALAEAASKRNPVNSPTAKPGKHSKKSEVEQLLTFEGKLPIALGITIDVLVLVLFCICGCGCAYCLMGCYWAPKKVMVRTGNDQLHEAWVRKGTQAASEMNVV